MCVAGIAYGIEYIAAGIGCAGLIYDQQVGWGDGVIGQVKVHCGVSGQVGVLHGDLA